MKKNVPYEKYWIGYNILYRLCSYWSISENVYHLMIFFPSYFFQVPDLHVMLLCISLSECTLDISSLDIPKHNTLFPIFDSNWNHCFRHKLINYSATTRIYMSQSWLPICPFSYLWSLFHSLNLDWFHFSIIKFINVQVFWYPTTITSIGSTFATLETYFPLLKVYHQWHVGLIWGIQTLHVSDSLCKCVHLCECFLMCVKCVSVCVEARSHHWV